MATPLTLHGFTFDVVVHEPRGSFSRWQKPQTLVTISQGEMSATFHPDELRQLCSDEGIIESSNGDDGVYFISTRSLCSEGSGAGSAVAGMSIDPSSAVFLSPSQGVLAVFTKDDQAQILNWLKLI